MPATVRLVKSYETENAWEKRGQRAQCQNEENALSALAGERVFPLFEAREERQ